MIQIHPLLTNFVRPSEHSKFSPSSADRWINCPFSIEYTQDTEVEQGSWAEEGTLAHAVCEAVFFQSFNGSPWPQEIAMKFGMLDDNSRTEMYDAACSYLQIIHSWLTSGHLGDILWYGVEKGVPIFPDQNCFGTGDFVAIGTKGALVLDFKYGRKYVKKDSIQLRSYLAGVFRHLIDIPADYEWHSVIYQPRIDIVPKHHQYTNHEMATHLEIIWNAINKSQEKGLSPVEGSEHCFWCPAKRTKDISKKCPIYRDRPEQVVRENFQMYFANLNAPVAKLGDPNPKRDEALMKIVALRPLINTLADEGEEELIGRLSRGEFIDGLTVVQEPGRRKWMFDKDEDVANLVATHFPQIEPYKEVRKIVSITDVEKVLGKGKCDSYTVRPLKKSLQFADRKQQAILGELSRYSKQLTLDPAEED